MRNPKIDFLGTMKKLTLSENDVLVVVCKKLMNREQLQNLDQAMHHNFPGTKCVILNSDLDLGVLAMPEIKVVQDGTN